jgi:DNA-binding winged helix-turn-helix (wHTH) protein
MSSALHQSATAVDTAQYRVGDLKVDCGSQRVTRGDDEIVLPKLSFDLLVALTRAAPNLLSIDGLMREVWPNYIVNPETVSQRVKLLRDALGDDPHAPRYIEGLRGRGYRMIAPVSRIASDPPEQAGEASGFAPDLAQPGSSARARHWIPAAALAAIVLVAGTTFMVTRLRESSREMPAAPSTLPEHTVAVLQFKNLSSDAQDEFVAIGIAEGVLHRLAESRDLTLIARTSSFSFRGKPTDAREIGGKLNARYLVEGSVQRSSSTQPRAYRSGRCDSIARWTTSSPWRMRFRKVSPVRWRSALRNVCIPLRASVPMHTWPSCGERHSLRLAPWRMPNARSRAFRVLSNSRPISLLHMRLSPTHTCTWHT